MLIWPSYLKPSDGEGQKGTLTIYGVPELEIVKKAKQETWSLGTDSAQQHSSEVSLGRQKPRSRVISPNPGMMLGGRKTPTATLRFQKVSRKVQAT